MKKIISLVLIFITFSLHANWSSEAELLNPDCEVSRPSYSRKVFCDQEKSDCMARPNGYNCNTFLKINGVVQEDVLKKAAWDQVQLDKRTAKENQIKDARKAQTKSWSSLTDAEKDKVIKYLTRHVKD